MISPIRNWLFSNEGSSSSISPTKAPHSHRSISTLTSLQTSEVTPSFKPIHTLKISISHRETIQNLLEELATKSVFHLACNGLRLMKIGNTLKEEVHPYLFLLEIFSNASSKKHLEKFYEDRNQIISGRSQIWSDFVKNLGKNFESREGDIAPYTFSFAQALNLDPSQVELHVKERNWESLLVFLLQATSS